MKYWIALSLLVIGIMVFWPYQPKISRYLKPLRVEAHNTGISGIDCIYCINLDIRKDKWERVQEEFATQGLHVNRVAAINGWKDLTKADYKKLLASEKALKPGQIGCFLSHLSVLKNAQHHQFKHILVLEDDITFPLPVKELSGYIEQLSKIDPEWDMLFLDNWAMEDYGLKERFDRSGSTMSEVIKKPKERISNFFRVYYRHALYGVVISKKGIDKLLTHFCKKPFLLAIDTEMNHIDQIHMYETDQDFVRVSTVVSDTWNKPKNE
jgi:GR25 family glycosyltransferase involved in LPS biosynthesis